jgi:hypothetical protein
MLDGGNLAAEKPPVNAAKKFAGIMARKKPRKVLGHRIPAVI